MRKFWWMLISLAAWNACAWANEPADAPVLPCVVVEWIGGHPPAIELRGVLERSVASHPQGGHYEEWRLTNLEPSPLCAVDRGPEGKLDQFRVVENVGVTSGDHDILTEKLGQRVGIRGLVSFDFSEATGYELVLQILDIYSINN